MSDEAANSELAVLVNINFQNTEFNEGLDEFIELVASAGLKSVATITCSRNTPDSSLYIGSGKAEEIKQAVADNQADVVIFNHILSPRQERNLGNLCDCKVVDRVGLILDIFAQRARSFEGKLQVELAQLQHLSSRLIRVWTHLERQKGGIGLRGPGETQLETDRRLIGKRIKTINTRLDKVRSQRQQGRKRRSKSNTPVVSLVGYTNAGKSTLFNRLTGSNVYTANKLFATLDPTFRRIEMAPATPVILTDTVGFIRHIPHDLVAAFHATLEETRDADLLLHIVDATGDQRDSQIEQVNLVINEIGAEDVPQIVVYNKIDQLEELTARIEKDENGFPGRVWLSAKTGDGIASLLDAITSFIRTKVQHHRLNIPASAGKLRANLFNMGVVRTEENGEDGGWMMEVDMESHRLDQLFRESGLELSQVLIEEIGQEVGQQTPMESAMEDVLLQ
ncbi:MAG: GTP-binding protein HflX [Gammaproteobacteria bacterium]